MANNKTTIIATINEALKKMTPEQCEAVLAITKTFVVIDNEKAETKAKKSEPKVEKKTENKGGFGYNPKSINPIKAEVKRRITECKDAITIVWDIDGHNVKSKGFKTEKKAQNFVKTLPTEWTPVLRAEIMNRGREPEDMVLPNSKYYPKKSINVQYEVRKVVEGFAIVVKFA